MPHQKPRAPKASRWRDVRAKAIKEERLNETALETHKHRMRALDGECEPDGPGMNDTNPDSPHEDVNAQAGHFYRVVRRGPGAQRLTTEPLSLDALRDDVRALLQDLEPGAFRLHPNSVTITGTQGSDEVTITVQYFVAQPTDPWAPATGGPTTDWSAWRHTVTQEAQKLGWYVRDH